MKTKLSGIKLFSFLFLTMNAIEALAIDFTPYAIYGEDNRNHLYSAPALIQNLARSVPGQFTKDVLVNRGGVYAVESGTLGKRHCSNVRFAEEFLGPRCTGFLVAPNVVATAGHCVKDQADCSNFYWAFDFKLKGPGDSSYKRIPAENVYTCIKVLAQKLEYFEGSDYALIQLDRDVTGRDPLLLDFTSETPVGTSLFVLGYPSGTPLKYTDAGTISKNLEKVYHSNLDTFGGNSGSPVFDANTAKVTGIVSIGNGDWVWNEGNTCKVAKICKEGDNCIQSISSKVNLMKEDFEKAIAEAKK
jgi:V8-like Glu-specific endopeptidase